MFTAFVLLCAQNYCFAVGGPSFQTENECIADFMQNGVIVRSSSAINATDNIIAGASAHDIKSHGNQSPIRIERNVTSKDLDAE